MATLSAPSQGMLAAAAAAAGPQLQAPNASDKNAAPPLRTSSATSLSSSPRQFSTDLTDSILEEGGESGSESLVEPVTPVSGRQSQDFTLHSTLAEALHAQDLNDFQSISSSAAATTAPIPIAIPKSAAGASSPSRGAPIYSSSQASRRESIATESTTPRANESEVGSPPLSRRPARGSTSSFKRTMSSLFRRSTPQVTKDPTKDSAKDLSRDSATIDSGSFVSGSTGDNGAPPRVSSSRRFSVRRSSNATRDDSPPSPGSPLEMARPSRDHGPSGNVSMTGSAPSQSDFKKNRASTGFSLRGRAVNFVGSTMTRNHNNSGSTNSHIRPALRRRASSFDGSRPSTPIAANRGQDETMYPPERLPWPLPPDSGTGAKARRMSLSLPDDFAVDVAELQSEFEYQRKFLGRHGKHVGKGAASKVTLMMRKGCPEELYAVKEFRGKSHRESQDEYEKKIKSEFSIAKSLHHPNIVETIRLCTDHGRWNHVMEYCSEGDLFSLVQKGHLKGEDRKKDRLCLFKQLIQGVSYLHANGIAHRDIKLENLLITKDSKVKITDFGVSEVFSGTHPGLREAGGQCGRNMGEIRLCSPGICGSEPYIAPEVLAKKHAYDPRALDVWSSAIVMIYLNFGGAIWTRAEKGQPHYDKLVTGWNNWNAKHDPDATITDTDYPKCYALDVGVTPPALRRLLLQMLNPDPAKRIGIDEVIHNRWMKNVECCQVESYEDPTQLIDATKKEATKLNGNKIFCHNHLPPKSMGSHSLGKMPGQAGY